MRHTDLIQKMTVEEKAAILSGRTEWTTWELPQIGLPAIFCSDGPHGLRKQEGAGDQLGLNPSLPATCFPTAATIANSWDPSLGEKIGAALGAEARTQGVHVVLGPGLNIKRSPLCGRNFEYFSEDPYLAGKMAAGYVRGLQSKGVYACPKHFAVNSQEQLRMSVDAVLDERTLRELYLTGFEIAIKEGRAKALMTSYNQVNGAYANENKHLLLDILRGEWGFDGIVISDWGGSNDHVQGVAARSNLEMPNPGLDSARQILSALEDGRLTMEQLDQSVDDLLDAILTLTADKSNATFDREAHHSLARTAAAESIVLLKNEDEILPLKKKQKVALIGDFAITPRYQGAGSSLVNPFQVETMVQAIDSYPLNCIGYAQGYRRSGGEDAELKKEALALAKRADVVLYCFGLDEISEVEGMDRSHMRLPQNQTELLRELAGVNPNIVAVLSGGSAIEMPWESDCKAILHGYLGGQAGASAMLDVLTGKVNPSGKLNETYPLRYEDTPAFHYYPSKERTTEHREGLFVGYRYYSTTGTQVRYPFGYGLSYTTFAYSDLHISEDGVEFTITNTGRMDGAEVAQLYIGGPRKTVFRPSMELKGFIKVFLKTRERQTVKIPFDDKTFRYWNVKTDRREVEAGTYTIYVGASSADIRLTGQVEQNGTTTEYPYESSCVPSYYSGKIREVPDGEFENLLGRSLPPSKWAGELDLNDAVCQMFYAKNGLARFVCKILTRKKEKTEAQGKPDLNLLFIYNIPFRGIAKMTGGAVSMEMVEGIVSAVNGHLFKGMGKVISGYFSNASANKEYAKKLTGGSHEKQD